MNKGVRYICLADDDPDDDLLFSTILKELDNSVRYTWLNNCEKLLNLLNTSSDLPDVILLDLNMPVISGEECLKKIKHDPRLSHMRVIIYSTDKTIETIKKAYNLGAYKYIVKPYSVDDLTSINKNLLTVSLKN